MHFHRKFWFHFFSRSYAIFELRNLAKMKDTTVFLVSATPLKSLNRILWNFVVMKDIMCRSAYPQEIWIPFFSLNYALFELQNFVVMKDIMCRYAFLQEMLIWSFWGAIYIPFFVQLPVTNAWNCYSLYTAFSSNVGAWGMWACSLFLSYFTCLMNFFNEG